VTETVYLNSSVRGRIASGACASHARSRGLQVLIQKNVGDVGSWQLEAGPLDRASGLKFALDNVIVKLLAKKINSCMGDTELPLCGYMGACTREVRCILLGRNVSSPIDAKAQGHHAFCDIF
jgi:hypothetical protein